MKKFVAGALAALLFTTAAQAQERLVFASPAPAPTPVHAAVLEGWAQRVTEASNGTIEIQLVTGGTLAAHGQVLERVQSGVVQIGWDIQGYYPGLFPRTEVVALPFGFETAEAGTMALNALFADGTIASEYDGMHILNLFTFPNGHVLGSTEMASLADMRGRRMTSLNPTRQDIASAVGGVPVSLSITDWYQGLNRRTVDAAIESYSAVPPFRLAEVTSHFIELPLGGNASFMFMNKDVYDGLPDEARAAIDAHSGPEFDRLMGSFWDGAAAAGRQMIEAAGGTITIPDDSERAAWEAAVQPVIEAWVQATPDGAAIREAFREAATAN
ncbi:MAG: TRAP transporter substrate-binding protein [Pararhodobacter sp.]|nr:TRAP transporter substrate-binding protein [Pararhodobacter sp.]